MGEDTNFEVLETGLIGERCRVRNTNGLFLVSQFGYYILATVSGDYR